MNNADRRRMTALLEDADRDITAHRATVQDCRHALTFAGTVAQERALEMALACLHTAAGRRHGILLAFGAEGRVEG